jgi:hypothetical protein
MARTGTVAEAIPVVGALVRELASLSYFAGLTQTKAMLRSKVIANALARLCALNVDSAIAQYDQLRPECGGAYSDAAVWTYVLFRPQLETTVLDQFMTQRLHPAGLIEDLRSREMLTQARRLLRALQTIQSSTA